ncbi:MAG: DUF1013 domain-containing protein [Hyphomicrobiales bacterium]
MALAPLMPKATAVWLVDNTSLSFEQIADFCQLHELEVKGIADGDVAQGIRGMDPLANGQLSRDELERGQADASYRLQMSEPKVEIPEVKTKRGPRYTPVSRRQDRPDAISWLLRYHPELTDGQVMKLVGTTKPTIQAIRDRTHWNTTNITPKDPVTLGLCSQSDLDSSVQKAARRVERERVKAEKEAIKAGTLLPTAATVSAEAPVAPEPQYARVIQATPEPVPEPAAPALSERPGSDEDAEPEYDAASVFAKLKDLKIDADEDTADTDEAAADTTDAAETDAAAEAESTGPGEAADDETAETATAEATETDAAEADTAEPVDEAGAEQEEDAKTE